MMPYLNDDIRGLTGQRDFVGGATVSLIYVAHGERLISGSEKRRLHASVDTGFIGQNVYLFCVSEGLGTSSEVQWTIGCSIERRGFQMSNS
jgi:hypothetical protein